MDALALLDVIIGMAFIYAVMALACTALNEYVVNTLGRCRGRILMKGIRNLLGNDTDHSVLDLFYSHPLIRGLYAPGRMPSTIPPDSFARSILDCFIRSIDDDGKVVIDADTLPENVSACAAPVDKMIRHLLLTTGGHYTKMITGLETWYNHATDRMIGWYKRRLQAFSLVFAVLLTIGMNVDSIALFTSLYSNPDAREILATMAAKSDASSFFKTGTNSDVVVNTDHLTNVTQQISTIAGLPISWRSERMTTVEVLFGWLITILAVSFGAPFWFDLLSRVMRLRPEMAETKKTQTGDAVV
ncbi:hypothetical protein JXA80_04700 [bacterium]|nr:hypothetical protein [candidate division CSSED10-310 bacterium]